MVMNSEKTDKLSLEDEHQISAVMVRYATGIDRHDWQLFRTCFTDDFCGDYGSFGTWTSGDEITRTMEEMHKSLGPTLAQDNQHHRVSGSWWRGAYLCRCLS